MDKPSTDPKKNASDADPDLDEVDEWLYELVRNMSKPKRKPAWRIYRVSVPPSLETIREENLKQ